MADQAREGLLSPFLRCRRIAAVRAHLKGRILDVGCGSGALAEFVPAASYVGVDVDETSVSRARARFPDHRFERTLPVGDEVFDTVACLAVIEHVADLAAFLRGLAARLAGSGARTVMKTPHPAVDWIHSAGAALGLFSRHASDEPADLLDRARLASLALDCDLALVGYARFLLGANPLAILGRRAE